MTDEIQKVYFTISEVGREINEPAFNVRFWDNHFKVSRKRTRANDRRFTVDDIEKLRTIKRLLKEDLYTIKGAKKQLGI